MTKKPILLLYSVIQFVFYLIVFGVFRALFLLKNSGNPDFTIPGSLVLKSFQVGAIFDLAIAGYVVLAFLIPWIVWLILPNGVVKKYWGGFLWGLFCVLHVILFFGMIADIEYYKTFSIHLNASAGDYLSTPKEILETIWTSYPVIQDLLLVALISVGFLWVTRQLWKNYRIPNKQPVTIVTMVLSILFTGGFAFLFARGGVGTSPLHTGRAYFCSNTAANQMALNGLYAFAMAVRIEKREQKHNVNLFEYYPKQEAYNYVREFFKSDNETLLPGENPLLRVTDTRKPIQKLNVVLVLMETWTAEQCGILGGKPDLTPEFNKLAKQGLLFDNFYSTGIRTNRGVLSSFCSYPSNLGKSVMLRETGTHTFYSLPNLLKDRGYNTSFLYGGDIEFDNMRGFLLKNGVDHFTGGGDFPKEKNASKWGAWDETLFQKTVDYMDTLPQPFFVSLLTLSNHEPFDLPSDTFKIYKPGMGKEPDYYNAYAYSDYALGKFMKEVVHHPYAKNTIFVFVADHGRNRHTNADLDNRRFRIPLLIYSPGGFIKPGVNSELGDQLDILPTVMQILGGKYTNAAWGKSLLQPNLSRKALMVQNEFWGLIQDKHLLVENLATPTRLYTVADVDLKKDLSKTESKRFEQMKRLSRAMMQVNQELIKTMRFGK